MSFFRQAMAMIRMGFTYIRLGRACQVFFGGLLKSTLPFLSSSIKGLGRISAPHIKNAGKDLVAAGSKRLIEKLSGDVVKKIDQPRTKKRKRRKI